MDGTNITKKEVATAVTITLSNESRALSLGTISIVMTGESYEVRIKQNKWEQLDRSNDWETVMH